MIHIKSCRRERISIIIQCLCRSLTALIDYGVHSEGLNTLSTINGGYIVEMADMVGGHRTDVIFLR